MDKNIFTQLGLSINEALVYDFLLSNGESSAGIIIKKTPLKRGVVYNALNGLVKKELIKKKNTEKVTTFIPNHPQKLWDFIENKEQKIRESEKTLEANLPKIISDFNLVSSRPGVQIFEGKEGLVKVLNDSLQSRTEILTYAQIEGMEKYLSKDNDRYVKERKKLGIKKRGIVADTPYARKYLENYDQSVTEIRFIDGKKYPLFLEMEIYDGKISFMTFSEKKLVGMIVENEEIYQTQKSIFEMNWKSSIPLKNIITAESSRF